MVRFGSMERGTRKSLERYRDDLLAAVPDAAPVLERIERADMTLTRAEPADAFGGHEGARTWLLYYKPTEHLRQRFALDPELLVVLIPGREAQARDIERAEKALHQNLRLDRGLVLAIARDQGVRDRLAQLPQHTGRIYVLLTFSEVEAAEDPQRWLRGVLLDSLGSSDLFAPGPPVSGWDFVGREQELQTIRRHLEAGRPVGLYGLRKIGKTSLLYKLRERLIADSDPERITIPIHTDMQRVSFNEMNQVGFMRYLIEQTYTALGEIGISPSAFGLDANLGNTRYLSKISADEVVKEGIQVLNQLVAWTRERPGQRQLILFIDEYERLLSGQYFPLLDGLYILDYLRGLVQSPGGRFNFVIAGLSRRLASQPRFEGRQNPLFNFAVGFPLAGLAREEMNELMRKLGRRLGLDFAHDALSDIWQQSGGHPYLARDFGRLVDQHVPKSERLASKKNITHDLIERLQDEFRRSVRLTLEEIEIAVSELDPDALFVLSYLQQVPEDAGAAVRDLSDEALDELCRLGIIERTNDTWRVRIGCFGEWLARGWDRARPTAAHG